MSIALLQWVKQQSRTTEAAVKLLKPQLNINTTLLVKGSRSAGMERIVAAIEETMSKTPPVELEKGASC